MNDRTRGLYHKFNTQRTDGRDAVGEKHFGCDYFVLDLTHDVHAWPALRAYVRSCTLEYPRLAAELTTKIKEKNDG